MRKGLVLACVLILASALPGAAAERTIRANPAAWTIKGAGKGQVTLFGSFHVLPANVNWLTPSIVRALMQSEIFVFEAPTDKQSQGTLDKLMEAHGRLPDGQSLRAMLPADAQSQYDATIAAANLKPDIADREKPWLLSLQLRLADTIKSSYYPDAGADYVLMDWATTRGLKVRYLETIDQQFEMLRPASDDLRLDEFQAHLKSWGRKPNHIEPMVAAWSKGDVARLGTLIDADFAGSPEVRQKLLTDRNKKWSEQIGQMLSEGRNFFVAVGAAHLAGPDGVPAMLRAAGYRVDGP